MREKFAYYLGQMQSITTTEKRGLVSAFGSSRNVFEASDEDILMALGQEKGALYLKERRRTGSLARITDMWDKMELQGIQYYSMEHQAYPENLRGMPSEPFGIYGMGQMPPKLPTIAIVGSRRASNYGKRMAEDLGYALGCEGIPVISGMARGVDSIAQSACLEAGGYTAAVLAGGVDVCYPGDLRGLYNKIKEKGCILSEHKPGTKPVPNYFPSRNRLISGLSDIVIVVEAAERSGSLITADMALDQGRDVYACPGRVGDVMSEGCNRLISQGAGIITSVDQFFQDCSLLAAYLAGREQRKTAASESDPMAADNQSMVRMEKKKGELLPHDELLVYQSLDEYPRGIAEICSRSKVEIGKLLGILTNLELLGYIEQVGTGYYMAH